MRTWPGETTLNAPINSAARERHTSATISALIAFANPAQAKQDDPGVRETLPEDKVAEVLVRRHQNRVPRIGLAEDLFVSNARRQLGT
jgi:hypothetical protein